MKRIIEDLNEKYILNNLRRIPGEAKFGNYRFLPLFFIFGATLEFLMCNLKVGPAKVNFCE